MLTEARRWPAPRTRPLDPPSLLGELRREEPISKITLWNGKQAWLVTRYADARTLLQDPRISADATDPSFPSMNPSQVMPTDRAGPARTGEPRHKQIRQMVSGQFTVKAVESWRPLSQRVAEQQVARLLAGGPPADLVSGYALPIPVAVISTMLGLPEDEAALVELHSQRIITRAADSALPALGGFREYVDDLVTRRERAPGDDLIGRLVKEQRRCGALSHNELADLVLIMLVAGHTTTASMIALGTLSLLEDPARFRAIRDDPALAARAVEEFLRYHTVVVDGAPRVAKADVAVAGVLIRAGDAVVISLAAANRDERAFTCPDTLDLGRHPRPHLAFGWGGHRCLGQHLARMELQIAFTTLARAVPTLRLAVPVDELRFRSDTHLHGLYELPVRW